MSGSQDEVERLAAGKGAFSRLKQGATRRKPRRTIADLVTEVMGEYLSAKGTFERLR